MAAISASPLSPAVLLSVMYFRDALSPHFVTNEQINKRKTPKS